MLLYCVMEGNMHLLLRSWGKRCHAEYTFTFLILIRSLSPKSASPCVSSNWLMRLSSILRPMTFSHQGEGATPYVGLPVAFAGVCCAFNFSLLLNCACTFCVLALLCDQPEGVCCHFLGC